MAQLPYLASPGNILKALDAIKVAATPPKVSQDFVKTKLNIPGSSGDQMTTFLKRLGFAASDGSPTELYRAFRGSDGRRSLAAAIKSAYSPLYARAEYLHDCDDRKIKDLIVQETGLASNARPVSLIFQTLKNLISQADFNDQSDPYLAPQVRVDRHEQNYDTDLDYRKEEVRSSPIKQSSDNLKLNLGYTINLNLPETTDIEVFNAIFKSLRANLLSSDND